VGCEYLLQSEREGKVSGIFRVVNIWKARNQQLDLESLEGEETERRRRI
jgi:hypothetical protein